MLHGPLHDRLIGAAAAVFALAVCLLAGPDVDAARADDAQVTVVTAGGEQRTLSLAALAGSEDVAERSYTLRSASGESTLAVTGFSLAAILTAAEADLYGFSYLEVQRPAGGSVVLSRDQALDPAAFAEGPPVLYATAAGTGFIRPSGSPGDLNASDSFEAPQGITVVLRNGSPLQVGAEASPLRTRPGKPVRFEAVVDRAGAGEQLDFSWYFDDGGSASGATATHSFAKRGSYDVVVGVTTPGNRAGASAVVRIQVGAPLSGPDRRGGGRDRDAAAPDHGAATGTRGAVPPGPGSAGRGIGVASPDTRPAAALSVRRSNTDTTVHKAGAGEPVVGELVRAVGPIEEGKPVAARSGRLEAGGEGAGLPGAALGLLVTAGLLGAGALAESRGALRSLSDRKAPQGDT